MSHFETQMVDWIETWKQNGKALHSAALGVLDPGAMAEQVFGDRLESGQLFLYLFRRFGAPIDPIDDFKQCAEYHFTTPRSDVWLGVSITGTDRSDLQFRYGITADLTQRLADEERKLVQDWHEEKDRWCREQGMDLPELPPYPTEETCPTEDEWDTALVAAMDARSKHRAVLDEALKRYTEAHPEKSKELREACGPLKAECHEALLATLRDLARPTYCRDLYFTPKGRVADGDFDYDEENDVMLYQGSPVIKYADPFDARLLELRKETHRQKEELELCRKGVADACVWFGSLSFGDYCPVCGGKIAADGSGHLDACPYPSFVAWDQYQAQQLQGMEAQS